MQNIRFKPRRRSHAGADAPPSRPTRDTTVAHQLGGRARLRALARRCPAAPTRSDGRSQWHRRAVATAPAARDTMVGVRVGWSAAARARPSNAAGGQGNRHQQVWDVRYDHVVVLGRVERIVAPGLEGGQPLRSDEWMLTSNHSSQHPSGVT
jgi:hypothetical protein